MSWSRRRLLVAFVVWLGGAATQSAAAPPVGLVHHRVGPLVLSAGPAIDIAGVTVSCPTHGGGLVWWVVSSEGGPAGVVVSRGGVSTTSWPTPHVFVRAALFGLIDPIVQLFIVLHECAHLALPPPAGADVFAIELAADCWAVRTGLAKGWFTPENLGHVRKHLLVPRAVAEWGHSGPGVHAENIPKCLSGR